MHFCQNSFIHAVRADMYDSVYSTAVCFIYIHRGSWLLPWCQNCEEFHVGLKVWNTEYIEAQLVFNVFLWKQFHSCCEGWYVYSTDVCFSYMHDSMAKRHMLTTMMPNPWRAFCGPKRTESLQNIKHWVNRSTNSALYTSVKTVSFMPWGLICMILFQNDSLHLCGI